MTPSFQLPLKAEEEEPAINLPSRLTALARLE
jgi:hypothetical protein